MAKGKENLYIGNRWPLAGFTGRQHVAILVLGIILSLCYHNLVVRRAVVDLHLDTDTRTVFKVYWAAAGQLYSEKRMTMVVISPGRSDYTFRICNLAAVKKLRIDVAEKPAKVSLHEMRITQEGLPELCFASPADFKKLIPLGGIAGITYDRSGTMQVVADNGDPQMEFLLPPMVYRPDYLAEGGRVLCIFVLLYLLTLASRPLREDYNYLSLMAVFVLALIVVMASISKYNQHPDEFVHVYAAEYYQNHLLPPEIGSPEIRHTYSPYGVSRLFSGEIVYLLAGKFMELFAPFHLPSYLILRFFNVTLFAVLCALASGSSPFRIAMLPVFISPQIWYVFSYFNSDAFALFVCMIVVYVLVRKKSFFWQAMADVPLGSVRFKLFLSGLLFSLLLFSKLNFYFFIIFLFFYLAWLHWRHELRLNKKTLCRLGMIGAVALVAFSLVRGADYAVNGLNRSAKLLACRERLAEKPYKPGTPLNQKNVFLQMKDRGVTLKTLLQLDRWGEKSFRSSFGVYGYTSVSASFAFYDQVRYVGLALLGVFLLSIALRGGWSGNLLLSATMLSAVALIVVACYHSWTVDFQAQGRYFLPIIPMLALLIYHEERHLVRPLFQWLFLAMYFLGTYNFIFVGLHDIAKYGS